MKTINQVVHYIANCRFTDGDWQKVLDYCRGTYGGGYVHRPKRPVVDSSYDLFLEWIRNGFGVGDYVGYGKTLGIIGRCQPGNIELIAYLDFNKNLIVKTLKVKDPERLIHLESVQQKELRKILFEAKYEYDEKHNRMQSTTDPTPRLCYAFQNPDSDSPTVGIFSKSDGCKYYFLAVLEDGNVELDKWVDSDYVPLHLASTNEAMAFNSALHKTGVMYSPRHNRMLAIPNKKNTKEYWYLTDRFEVARDIDNGTQKHDIRFKNGNYFLDQAQALLFMEAVKKLANDIQLSAELHLPT